MPLAGAAPASFISARRATMALAHRQPRTSQLAATPIADRDLRVVAAALHRELALEIEDLDLLRLPVLLRELVTAERRRKHAEIGTSGKLTRLADLGRGEDG